MFCPPPPPRPTTPLPSPESANHTCDREMCGVNCACVGTAPDGSPVHGTPSGELQDSSGPAVRAHLLACWASRASRACAAAADPVEAARLWSAGPRAPAPPLQIQSKPPASARLPSSLRMQAFPGPAAGRPNAPAVSSRRAASSACAAPSTALRTRDNFRFRRVPGVSVGLAGGILAPNMPASAPGAHVR